MTRPQLLRLLPALGLLVAAGLLLGLLLSRDTEAPRAADQLAAPTGSGAYVGAGAPDELAAFGTTRGGPPAFAVDFLAREDWTKISAPDWWLQRWSAAGTPLVVSVPLLPDTPGGSLQDGARGAYDEHFRTLARNLVDHGYAHASLRLGWEFNGGWYRWSAADDPAAFAAYWRHVVDAMRSVDGQAFTFDWNPALGWNSVRAEEAWPGDDYVDVVGIDVYDWVYGEGALSPEDRWDRLLTMEYGLDWFASFAAEHGKPLSVPEWGLASANSNGGGGGGDDPLFVRNLAAWMSEHRVVYEAYFDVDLPGGERHALTAFPTAATAYRELFGSAAG